MKFKVGDEVFCKLSEEELEDEESLTNNFCGLDDQMLKACGGDPLMVVNITDHGDFATYLLKGKCFKGTWWFHEADLEFYNFSLENE